MGKRKSGATAEKKTKATAVKASSKRIQRKKLLQRKQQQQRKRQQPKRKQQQPRKLLHQNWLSWSPRLRQRPSRNIWARDMRLWHRWDTSETCQNPDWVSDIENGFKPEYIDIRGKGELRNELKKKAKKSSFVYLATDPDREGEAISWHLSNMLGLDNNQENRVTFNEITKSGVKNGMAAPRHIDVNLVNAPADPPCARPSGRL